MAKDTENGKDDLGELDGLFKPKPKKKATEKTPAKSKVENNKPVSKNKPTKPKKAKVNKPTAKEKEGEGFFDEEQENAVALAKKHAEIDKIVKETKSKNAISSMLAAVDLDSNISELQTFRISKNYGDLADRFQSLLRYSYGFGRREVPVRKIFELLLKNVATDLKEKGPESKFIRMMLEDKHL